MGANRLALRDISPDAAGQRLGQAPHLVWLADPDPLKIRQSQHLVRAHPEIRAYLGRPQKR